jgi:DNA-binding NarL/FixJ family response regulator
VTISIVLVDDQELVRAGLRTILDTEPGLIVTGEAADGESAIGLVSDLRPDVVLLDVRMPGMDGITTAGRLRALPAPPKIIVLTTYDLDEYVYRALKGGASGFLLKDAPADRLITAVHAAVRDEAIFAPEVTRRLVETYIQARPRPAPPRGAQDLTRRESDVWRLLAQGMSNAEIARTLGVGDATAKTHVARLLTKLGVRDRVQAVVLAYETGTITPGTPGPRP